MLFESWNDSCILEWQPYIDCEKVNISQIYKLGIFICVFIYYTKEILSVLPPFIIYNKYFYNGKEMINFENINGNDDKDTYRLSRILRIQCTYKYVHIIHVFNEFL